MIGFHGKEAVKRRTAAA